MREACGLKSSDGLCDEPAVDFIMVNDGKRKIWLCAQHFDRWTWLCKVLGWANNPLKDLP